MTNKEFEAILEEVAGERSEKEQVFDARFCEREEGKTPNGGDYSVAYYYDEDGNPCKKNKAASIHIVEYSKDGCRINETYGYLAIVKINSEPCSL